MFKFIQSLLLHPVVAVLCVVPLFIVTEESVRELFLTYQRGPGGKQVPTRSGAEGDLEAGRKRATAIRDTAKAVYPSLVRQEDGAAPPPEAVPENWAQPTLALVKGLTEAESELASGRDEAKTLGAELRELQGRLVGPDGVPRDDPALVKEIEGKLAAYQKLRVQDVGLRSRLEVEVGWARLRHDYPTTDLENVFQQLENWQPSGPASKRIQPAGWSPDDPRTLEGARRQFQEYASKAHDVAAPLAALAKEQERLWAAAASLASVLSSATAPLEKLRALAAFLSAGPVPDRAIHIARRAAQLLCAAYLPVEPLDATVISQSSDGVKEPVPRKSVRLKLVGQPGTVPLGDGGTDGSGPAKGVTYDEWSVADADVEYFQVGEASQSPNSDADVPNLVPTPYSEAVHAFDVHRAEMVAKGWSLERLKAMLAECESKRAQLMSRGESASGNDLPDRVRRLLDVVRSSPSLLATGP